MKTETKKLDWTRDGDSYHTTTADDQYIVAPASREAGFCPDQWELFCGPGNGCGVYDSLEDAQACGGRTNPRGSASMRL
jgi:hypothetical protein